jgi:hypothetical protein
MAISANFGIEKMPVPFSRLIQKLRRPYFCFWLASCLPVVAAILCIISSRGARIDWAIFNKINANHSKPTQITPFIKTRVLPQKQWNREEASG